MKSAIIALLSAAVVVVADVHNLNHQHLHARVANGPDPAYETVNGPTVVVYELNGKFITHEEVEQGIKNGTLVYAPNGQVVPSGSIPSSTSSTSWTAPTTAKQAAGNNAAVNNAAAPSPPTSSSSSSSSPPPPPPTTSSTSSSAPPSQSSSSSSSGSSGNSGSSLSGGQGVDSEFPNNTISCSTFPSSYGAVSVDWEGLGGWSGVQTPGSNNGGFDNIVTVKPEQCSDGNCCTEGSYCSYACPAGYSKAQWPTTQGATGQSVGGLLCSGGKLIRTNGAQSNLCMKGASQLNVEIVNNLGQNVAICRTDYPGTESMTIPLIAQAGSTVALTCPDADTSYHWKDAKTSAQYYVNPAGVSVSDACTWGQLGSSKGNFAPLNLGLGWDGSAAWPSVFQNAPTTSDKLGFTVEIQGDNISGSCKYQNGQYCGSNGCSSDGGCTVHATSGTVKYVFS